MRMVHLRKMEEIQSSRNISVVIRNEANEESRDQVTWQAMLI